jgi:thiol:disulfide interchange protein DsbD
MAAAKREHKPIMIDFTGLACVNCRKMEENVWSQPEVLKVLNENYILLSLYVDDRQPLPESVQYHSPVLDQQVKTTGKKWSDLEVTCFKNNSQPLYALIGSNHRLLNEPRGYTPKVDEYLKFLKCGLESNMKYGN